MPSIAAGGEAPPGARDLEALVGDLRRGAATAGGRPLGRDERGVGVLEVDLVVVRTGAVVLVDEDPVVVALPLDRVAQDLPRGTQTRLLLPGGPDDRLGGLPRLLFFVARGADVGELGLIGGADLLLRRVRLDLEQLVVGLVVAHGSRPRRASTRPSIGRRSWPIVSRSRTVTALSSSVSKSMVTHQGVPTSS